MDSSPRLHYEVINPDHAPLIFAWYSDPVVWRFITAPPPSSVEELTQDFARKAMGRPLSRDNERWVNYVVRVTSTGVCIGLVQATIIGDVTEVAYVLGPDYWGQGYATEAMHWLHAHLEEQGLGQCFWASVLPTNERSIALLLRLGYERVTHDWPPLASHMPGDFVFHRAATN
jgi:RimJ/RimL family protein N-acetyltransferase